MYTINVVDADDDCPAWFNLSASPFAIAGGTADVNTLRLSPSLAVDALPEPPISPQPPILWDCPRSSHKFPDSTLIRDSYTFQLLTMLERHLAKATDIVENQNHAAVSVEDIVDNIISCEPVCSRLNSHVQGSIRRRLIETANQSLSSSAGALAE